MRWHHLSFVLCAARRCNAARRGGSAAPGRRKAPRQTPGVIVPVLSEQFCAEAMALSCK